MWLLQTIKFDPINASDHHTGWCNGCPPQDHVAFLKHYKLGEKVASNYLLCSS